MSGHRRYALLAVAVLAVAAALALVTPGGRADGTTHPEHRLTVAAHPASVDTAVLADSSAAAGARAILDLGRLLALTAAAVGAGTLAWRRRVSVDHRDRGALHRIRHAVGLRGPPRDCRFA